VIAGIVLEPLEKNARVFLVLVALLWWFLCDANQMFGEMCVRL
jgi:hypothetical protein